MSGRRSASRHLWCLTTAGPTNGRDNRNIEFIGFKQLNNNSAYTIMTGLQIQCGHNNNMFIMKVSSLCRVAAAAPSLLMQRHHNSIFTTILPTPQVYRHGNITGITAVSSRDHISLDTTTSSMQRDPHYNTIVTITVVSLQNYITTTIASLQQYRHYRRIVITAVVSPQQYRHHNGIYAAAVTLTIMVASIQFHIYYNNITATVASLWQCLQYNRVWSTTVS